MNVTRTSKRKAAAVAMAAIAAIALGPGCGAEGATKAGTSTDPVVLRMANSYVDLSYQPAVAHFVKRVGERSHGALRVKVLNDWGSYNPGVEQRIVRTVGDGKVDLAWVGTRIFDTLGVGDFQALTAPILIDSYPLQRAVISSELPGQMLKGLDKLKVTGLAVLGGGLRKPIAVRRPLLSQADWRGVTFAAFRSRSQAEAIRALGARPSEAFAGALDVGLDAGTIQGFEKNLRTYRINEMWTSAPYVTANVNLWPETVALLADPKRLSGLKRKQQRWLNDAAADAAARSTSLVDSDARDLAAACQKGARFADASAADLAGLKQALAPVDARLQQDPRTKAFIAQIAQLKASTPAGPALTGPAACRGAAETPKPNATVKGNDPGGVLNGVHRVKWSEQELISAGTSRKYAAGNAGLITMTLRDGDVLLRWAGDPVDCRGAYGVSGSDVSIALRVGCHGTITARWSRRGGQLRLRVSRVTDPGDKILFGAKPWKKIG